MMVTTVNRSAVSRPAERIHLSGPCRPAQGPCRPAHLPWDRGRRDHHEGESTALLLATNSATDALTLACARAADNVAQLVTFISDGNLRQLGEGHTVRAIP